MAVTLQLKPDVQAGLAAQAQARGLSLEHYLDPMHDAAVRSVAERLRNGETLMITPQSLATSAGACGLDPVACGREAAAST